tara:strand:- start:113 stop:280 length:168 start_codon:yes stop_codon:yes gene_type:complete
VNLLCIDIGNTNIVVGTYRENQLVDVVRLETIYPNIKKRVDLKTTNYIAISSVVP